MDSYEAKDVTKRAKELSHGRIKEKIKNGQIDLNIDFNRTIKNGSIEKGPKGIKIKTLGVDGLSINRDEINLRAVEQLVDREQVNFIGEIMKWAEDNVIDGKKTLTEVADAIFNFISKNGMLSICNTKGGLGNLAMVRKHEIMAAFNRYRRLKIK